MKYFVLSILTTFSGNVLSQSYSFKHYSVISGLPTNETYAVTQNKQGFILVGTENGVVQFDGQSFEQVEFHDKALKNISVFDFIKDTKGRIWAKSYHHGIFLLRNKTFFPFKHNIKVQYIVGSSFIDQIQIDSGDNVWFTVGGVADTLYRINKKGFVRKVISDSLPNGSLSLMYSLPGSRSIVLATKSYSKKTGGKPKKKDWQAITLERDKKVLLQAAYSISNLSRNRAGPYLKTHDYYYVSFKNTVLKFNYNDSLIDKKIFSSEILYLYLDSSCNLLIATRKGAYIYSPSQQQYNRVLDNEQVCNIFQDDRGGYWFSTTTNGIFYLPSLRLYSLSVTHTSEKEILGVSGSKKYLTLVGTKKIVIYKKTNKQFKLYAEIPKRVKGYNPKNTIIKNDTLFAGNFFIALSDNKEHYLNVGKESSIRQFFLEENTPTLAVVIKSGFLIVNYSTGKVRHIISDNSKLFTCVIPYKGDYYLGTNNGLYLYRKGEGLKHLFPENITQKVRDIKIIDNGQIIISTKGQGIFIIKNNRITHLDKHLGLSSRSCGRIVIQNNKVFWVATNFGLNKIELKDEKHIVISTVFSSDGLASNFIRDIAIVDDILVILTEDKINYFDINNFKIGKGEIRWVGLKINNISVKENNSFTIEPTSRSLSISPEIINIQKIPGLIYSFILKNEDFEIRQETENKHIIFESLPPGQYTLYVDVIFSGHTMLNSPLTYSITITPLFFEQAWFKPVFFGLITFIILVVVIFYFLKRERVQKRKNTYYRLQLEALSLQISPHFLFNALNGVLYLSTKHEYSTLNKFISQLSTMLRRTMNNSLAILIPLKQELDNTVNYIEMEQFRFGTDTFLYDFEVDTNLKVNDLEVPPMILQPIVENAIWHGLLSKEENRRLKISVKAETSGFVIQIYDNGLGFSLDSVKKNSNTTKKSLGLKNVRRRLELYNNMGFGNATFKIQSGSYQQEGTLVFITIMPKK